MIIWSWLLTCAVDLVTANDCGIANSLVYHFVLFMQLLLLYEYPVYYSILKLVLSR